MVSHLVRLAESFSPDRIVSVVAPGFDSVIEAVEPYPYVVQEKLLGTGHATLQAMRTFANFEGTAFVLFGDTPLLTHETLGKMLTQRAGGYYAGVILGFRPADPLKYGRLIISADGSLERIVEYKDATPDERAIDFCNSGVMCVDARLLFEYLQKVDNHNASGEYYLFDIIGMMRKKGLRFGVTEGIPEEVSGANTREELAVLEHLCQNRLRRRMMAAGVTLEDPATTYFSLDTAIGMDTVVGPCVSFGLNVRIGARCKVRPLQRLENVTAADGETV